MKLTSKQETFCKEYITNGGNATQAYKKAYDCSKMKDKTINENASRLLKDSKVRARLEELQQPFQKKFEYTMEQSFKKFNELQELALKRISITGVPNPDVANAIKCEENKAKLCGLFVEPETKLKIKGNLAINDLSKVDTETLLKMAEKANINIDDDD